MIHAGICGRLRKFKTTNETEVLIKLSWNVPIERQECKNIIAGYKITYGTTGQSLESTFIKWENQTRMNVSLENLIPGAQYLVVITVKYTDNRVTLKRPMYITAGRGMFN